MKLINIKSLFAAAIAMLGTCLGLQAQEFKTDQSIRNQIKNNSVPGAVYAPANELKQAPVKTSVGSSLAKQIKEGKLGMPVLQSNGSTASVPANETKSANAGSLPSEQSSAQAKSTIEAAKKNAVPTTQPPLTQEEKAATPVKKEN